MIPSLPNPSNPAFWIGIWLIVAYFGADYVGQIPAAIAWVRGKLTFNTTTSNSAPTFAAATQALSLIKNYRASTTKDALESAMFEAGLKRLLEAQA